LSPRVFLAIALVAGCASPAPPEPRHAASPPGAPALPPPVTAAPAPDAAVVERPAPTIHEAGPAAPDPSMDTRHLSEQQWLATTRATMSRALKADPAELRFSPDKQWVAVLRGPATQPGGKPSRRPRRFQIVAMRVDGKRPLVLRPVVAKHSEEPPKDLHFLADGRLAYEVVSPPPPPPRSTRSGKHARAPKVHPAAHPGPPGPPPRLFVIQPLAARARPVRCLGTHFTSPAQQDHLAYLSGAPEAAYVAVDGVQVYPRKGRAAITTEPAWSKDGHSLAFIEARPGISARLVLLAEYDNPTGDTTWDLPASASLEGARVSWAGPGKLVVGKSAMKPVFAASFAKEKPAPAWREP
jgi:hypothetical protein